MRRKCETSKLTVTVEKSIDSANETSDLVNSSVGSLKKSGLVLSLNEGVALYIDEVFEKDQFRRIRARRNETRRTAGKV